MMLGKKKKKKNQRGQESEGVSLEIFDVGDTFLKRKALETLMVSP